MGRVPADRLVAPGLGFILLGSLGTMTLSFGALSFLHVMVPVAIYAIGIAFIMPAMSTAALAPFGREAGSAASMMGFLQMGSGLLIGSIGALMGDAVLAMSLLIPLMGLGACIAYRVYRSHPPLGGPEPRSLEPAPTPAPRG
jgi:DHA1 family bicyclomycin/chloramphenicol resistance-like MFS transporter